MIAVEVFSDVICPWCYIGKRRLESALRMVGDVGAEVRWLPFELNPQMPPQGMERRAYRAAKFGSWERAAALDAQVAEAGRSEGLAFAFDRIERTPNTLEAHRLIALAYREGVQDAVVEAIFRAYFTEGRDLSLRTTLLDAAAGAGLDRARATRWLEGDEGTAEVQAEEARGRLIGVGGVPHFVIGGRLAFSGARDAGAMAAALRSAREPLVVLPTRAGGGPGLPVVDPATTRQRYGFERTRCSCDFCRAYCKHVAGRLDVSDLARLCPEGEDAFAWAERHLRAVTDKPYPKLVPARQENGHCHWFRDGLCGVHENAPYGCAFFDSHMPPEEVQRRSRAASLASQEDAAADGLYSRVWRHLCERGLTSPPGDREGLDEELGRIKLSMERS
jgi:predicted DsbA family dithiol-disulfide isomerase